MRHALRSPHQLVQRDQKADSSAVNAHTRMCANRGTIVLNARFNQTDRIQARLLFLTLNYTVRGLWYQDTCKRNDRLGPSSPKPVFGDITKEYKNEFSKARAMQLASLALSEALAVHLHVNAGTRWPSCTSARLLQRSANAKAVSHNRARN